MNAQARTFSATPAVRGHVPLLVGLMGPSGGGKTFSALRLASGIQQVTGGEIYGVDTEARRMLHYADRFKFNHVPFDAPFGSLDYLEVLKYCVGKGAGVVIVDSMSHEHEGPGGLIDVQDQEMHRLARDDYGTRAAERFNMLAWQKPKAARRKLINGLLQLNANFIFCFRSKQTSKPVKTNGKTEIVPMGFMPIAGDEFVFEMTMNALLLPGAEGVPTWQSENVGERMMMKLPEQFRGLMRSPGPLDEKMGVALATWARGDKEPSSTIGGEPNDGAGPETGSQPRSDAPTLPQRTAAFRNRFKDAANTTKMRAIWAASSQLREDLDRADPEELAAVTAEFEAWRDELEAAEKAST